MALLKPRAKVFEQARNVADRMEDATVKREVLTWLEQAENYQLERHTIVHSILLYDSRPGFNVYHPRSGELRRWSDDEIRELAQQIHTHADEANCLILFDWRQALESLNNSTTEGQGLR